MNPEGQILKGEQLWVDHPEHGTQRAKVAIVAGNQKSIGLELDTPVALVSPLRGMVVSPVLAFSRNDAGKWVELVTGQVWEITRAEPAIKHPTK